MFIAIASAVINYAKIIITKTKLNIINKGGNIYYNNTNNIVTNTSLNFKLVGKNLGLFKLVHTIKKAYFITGKTYIIINIKNKKSITSAGVTKPKRYNKYNLNLKKFIALYKGLKVKIKRNKSSIDFSEGYVNLNTNKITLYKDFYAKRSKVYNNKNKWINIKSLTINVNYKRQ